ncbi:MAG TPA: GNAT family N-acetyltransferase [Gemmatimonadaceae bacterium]|nr:GNAT family N-acetyltransferase [Gemmatimonadaceae bacterium]
MPTRPTLDTSRLVLRPFTLADAPAVQRLAGAREVADTTLTIPHPYEAGMAEEWIGMHEAQFAAGEGVTFAITERDGGALVGAIGLTVQPAHARAELGYWLGTPYWGRGYCTEAARAVLGHAFDALALHRVWACHFARNPASGRVLQKIGMTREGCLRGHIEKWGRFEDVEMYGVIGEEWVLGSSR